MKVLVCDYEGISAQWIEQFAIKENLEVVGTITPATDKKLLTENSWEYLLIFEGKLRKFFELIVTFFGIDERRVIYAGDKKSWAAHPAAAYAMIDPKKNSTVYRATTLEIARNLNYLMAVTTEDNLNYVATSADEFVLKTMYVDRENHVKLEMKFFHELVKKFYDVDDSEGLFLDLGANIGTTGIYFTKKIAPNLKLLAFEPDPENFKLLRANLILNDAEKNSVAENFGLGEVEDEMTIYRDKNNPGHNGVYSNDTGVKADTIKIIPLDEYFVEKNLSPKDVKYIWIDTEGFEPQVLFGMKNILTENPAPIFMEFNPQYWQKSGYYEKFVALLKKFYEGYVWVPSIENINTITVLPIETLFEFQDSTAPMGVLADIFLIHKL